MTTTPEPTRGTPRIEGNPAPTLRADHNDLADYVRDTTDATVSTTADLPLLKNWVNRRITTLDTMTEWRWRSSAAGWEQVGPDLSAALSSTQALGQLAPNGVISDVMARSFTEKLPRLVLITVTATASASGAASGNLYVRLNGRDVLTPATARQHRLAGGTQNFVSLVGIGRTQGGANTLSFAASSDPGGNTITFEQIGLGAKAF